MDGGKVLLLVIIAVLSFVLMLASYGICNHYSLTTPGTFVEDRVAIFLQPAASRGWGPGYGILVALAVDFACWFGALSGLCWLVQKLRS